MQEIDTLKSLIQDANHIAFLGGAGVSTESGIPDFRSEQGVFRTMEQFGKSPETLLSHSFFMHNPEVFYQYYRACMLYPDAKPNAAHRALAKLEAKHKLTAVITQNIDGLHQKAGSRNVLELHGSVYRNYCMQCHKTYLLEDLLATQGVPHCACGGMIRPDVVLYEESLDASVLEQAIEQIRKADLFLVGGTSLSVYPAAGLLRYFQGNKLVLINKGETQQDAYAMLAIHEPIGEVLQRAVGD